VSPAPAPAPAAAPGELSGLALMLAQLDALLRDPTLTNALRAFAARLGGGLRPEPARARATRRPAS